MVQNVRCERRIRKGYDIWCRSMRGIFLKNGDTEAIQTKKFNDNLKHSFVCIAKHSAYLTEWKNWIIFIQCRYNIVDHNLKVHISTREKQEVIEVKGFGQQVNRYIYYMKNLYFNLYIFLNLFIDKLFTPIIT